MPPPNRRPQRRLCRTNLSPQLSVRRPSVRILCALAAFLSLATFAPARLIQPVPFVHQALIRFTPIPLDRDDPGRTRLGRLVYLGGWEMRSDNPRFGGISALHVADGEALGLSDSGWLIRFPLPGRKAAVEGRITALADGPGSREVKRDRDTESMALFGGRAWIGFERQNAVWRYAVKDWRSDTHAKPKGMARWPNNSGPETIIRLADGRFLVFSEEARRAGGTTDVLLFEGDPAVPGTRAVSFGYRAPAGYDATDGTLLPDGRLLLLNRRFTIWEGVSAKLVVAAAPGAHPPDVIAGEEIADLRSPINVDNMEGVSVTQEGGRTIVWIASDNNFNPMQRSLLLKFALE